MAVATYGPPRTATSSSSTSTSSGTGELFIRQARARLRPTPMGTGQMVPSEPVSSTVTDIPANRDSADTIREGQGPTDFPDHNTRQRHYQASLLGKNLHQRRHNGGSSEIREEDEQNGEAKRHDGIPSSSDDVIVRGEEDVLAFEGYVMALHDFTPSNPDCLSFRSNQIIKVHNRDPSGWWDGELDGERGWFPSNYVDDSGLSRAFNDIGRISPHSDPLVYHSTLQSQRKASRSSLRSTADAESSTSRSGQVSTRGEGRMFGNELKHRSIEILEPIQHSIALLQNAVRAARWAHFQPATACVISSVRSVLSETDCLTRESATLRQYPGLAKERKQVLSELSRLVSQSRRASDLEDNERPSEEEMEAMLRYAFKVLANTRSFLAAASAYGANVPTKWSSSFASLQDQAAGAERSELDKTPTPGSPGSSYLTATQYIAPRRSALKEGTLTEAEEAQASNSELSGDEAVPDTPESCSPTQKKESASASSQSERSSSSDLSLARGKSGHSGGDSEFQETSTLHTREEIDGRAARAHEHIVSVVAAFVGHLHTHTRDSPASSYVYLVDLTREAVDAVTNLLVIVEGVQECVTLRDEVPMQIVQLVEARNVLYEVISALVTAARTSLTRGVQSTDANSLSPPITHGELEKRRLLSAATKLVMTSQMCVAAVKSCLSHVGASFQLFLTSPTKAETRRDERAETRRRQEVEQREEEEEREIQETLTNAEDCTFSSQSEEAPSTMSSPQREHSYSLSSLDRKASSLICLKQYYDSGSPARPAWREISGGGISPREDGEKTITADGLRDESERHGYRDPLTRPTINQRRGITAPSSLLTSRRENRLRPHSSDHNLGLRVGTLAPVDGAVGSCGTSSDSSDDMSRKCSRTSQSTIYSMRSNPSSYTEGTSARQSMDRRQSDASAVSEDAKNIPFASVLSQKSELGAPSGKDLSPPPRSRNAEIAPVTTISDQSFLAPEYHPEDICFNADGQVTGATLPALVEKMTPHASMVSPEFSTPFFLCFRVFCSPQSLFEALVTRYNLSPPPEVLNDEQALARWTTSKGLPIRARVLNVFKIWMELHWQPVGDRCILKPLIAFIQCSTTPALALSAQRVLELATKRLDCKDGKITALTAGGHRGAGCLKRTVSIEKLKGPLTSFGLIDVDSMYLPSAFSKGVAPAPPAPIVTKSLLASLRTGAPGASLNILDLNPLELARQLTIMESKVFCCILPEELIGQQDLIKKPGHHSAVHVKQMSALTTQITGWIAECILDEDDTKKRTQLVKYFIKLGDRCLSLQNFNALFAIQSALNASTIGRLKKTWDGLSSKYSSMMEAQSALIEHTRNFSVYRSRLRAAVAPALPFVGLFLTDITFCHQGNAPTRPSPLNKSKQLINFDKFVKKARIVQDLQRFQAPFNLVEVPEIQAALKLILGGGDGTGSRTAGPEELYKRSLFLEPRKNSAGSLGPGGTIGSLSSNGNGNGSGSASKTTGGLDIFNWK